jgi:hypothetical protein
MDKTKDDDASSEATREDIEGAGARGVNEMETMLARPEGFEQVLSAIAV